MNDEEYSRIVEHLEDQPAEESSLVLLKNKFGRAGFTDKDYEDFLRRFKHHCSNNSLKGIEIVTSSGWTKPTIYNRRSVPYRHTKTKIGQINLFKWEYFLNPRKDRASNNFLINAFERLEGSLGMVDEELDTPQVFGELMPFIQELIEKQISLDFTVPNPGLLETYILDTFANSPPTKREFRLSDKGSTKNIIFYGRENSRKRDDKLIERMMGGIYEKRKDLDSSELKVKFEQVADVLLSGSFNSLLSGSLERLVGNFSKDFLRDKLYAEIKNSHNQDPRYFDVAWLDYDNAAGKAKSHGRLDLAAEFLEKAAWTSFLERKNKGYTDSYEIKSLIRRLKEPFKMHVESGNLKTAGRIFINAFFNCPFENSGLESISELSRDYGVDKLDEEQKDLIFQESFRAVRGVYKPSNKKYYLHALHDYFEREIDDDSKLDLLLTILERESPEYYREGTYFGETLPELKKITDPDVIENVREVIQRRTESVSSNYASIVNSAIYHDISSHFGFRLDESFYKRAIDCADFEMKYEDLDTLREGLKFLEPLRGYLKDNEYAQELSTKVGEIIENGKRREEKIVRNREINDIFR